MTNSLPHKTIHVAASRSYDIIIGDGILATLGEYVQKLFGKCRLALLTDSNVDALHGEKITTILTAAGALIVFLTVDRI